MFPNVQDVLSLTDRCVIGLGLKHIPSYPVSPTSLLPTLSADVSKYMRLIKLAMYFFHTSKPTLPLFPANMRKNNWLPPDNEISLHLKVDKYHDTILRNITQHLHAHHPITPSATDVKILAHLKALSKRTDIVIRAADKNLGPVVMLTEQYNKMCMQILSDTATYAAVDNHNPNDLHASLRIILAKHKHLYSFNYDDETLSPMAKSLLQLENDPKLRIPVLYVNPKMHKLDPNNPDYESVKGRPIVNNDNSATVHSSMCTHNYLLPIRKHLPNI